MAKLPSSTRKRLGHSLSMREHAYLSTQACQLADALYALGRYQESEQWVLRGLESGASEDALTQVCGLGVRSKLLARKGDGSTALALAEQADGLARATEAPEQQGDAQSRGGPLSHGRPDASRRGRTTSHRLLSA